MILIQYTLKKVFKNQVIILVLLCLVCICQKLINILGSNNNISTYFIILYLILNIPELGKLLIPFSLFLSVIITYYQFYTHNEILAMYSCGANKYTLIKSILFCSTISACIAFINTSWIYPYCEQYQYNISSRFKKNMYLNICTEKKFQLFPNKHLILFVDHINNKKLQNIFIANTKQNEYNNIISIITANQGNIYNNPNNFQSITLNQGTYYQFYKNKETYTNICITNFTQHHMLINNNSKLPLKKHQTINHMFINQLWNSSLIEAKIELHWQLTLIISIFILPMLALLLINDMSCQFSLKSLLSMILYIIFFILHILLRSYSISSSTNTIVWVWLVNFIYFIIIYLINFSKKIPFIFFKTGL